MYMHEKSIYSRLASRPFGWLERWMLGGWVDGWKGGIYRYCMENKICFLVKGDDDQKENDVNDDTNAVDETEDTFDSGLVEEEEKDVGVVKYNVYRSYWQAAGVCLTFSILLSLFLMQGKLNIDYSNWPKCTSNMSNM